MVLQNAGNQLCSNAVSHPEGTESPIMTFQGYRQTEYKILEEITP
jgi:hypothetical protein